MKGPSLLDSGADISTQVGVLVVDDSALMQRLITRLLERDPSIRVIGTALDGLEAVDKVVALRPDVVTLDIEMPRLDGLEALRRIMAKAPTPVVMLSALGEAEHVMTALHAGAVDFVTKPSGTVSVDLYKVGAELVRKVKLATFSRLIPVSPGPMAPAGTVAPGRLVSSRCPAMPWCVALGASTGGPSAISQFMRQLPEDFPGSVLIVQHMPPGFTRSFAQRLDRESALTVVEAEDGSMVRAGHVYVAPGDAHMVLARSDRAMVIDLLNAPPVHSVRPSIDLMMASVAQVCGSESLGVLLTGMGRDGAAGLGKIRAAGGRTIVQDRETSMIFGMPRTAIELGVADRVLPISEIAGAVMRAWTEKAQADD